MVLLRYNLTQILGDHESLTTLSHESVCLGLIAQKFSLKHKEHLLLRMGSLVARFLSTNATLKRANSPMADKKDCDHFQLAIKNVLE
ncbi:MAG: hypothetical protein EBR01_03400 [Proteobacteria bacterium]|nr:hypothetical protein [Pseudomonadota bacterium]NBY20867.1 hypothetical protein [bacterium]